MPLDKNWPHQLVDKLNSVEFTIEAPRIVATTGWTTDELINAVEEQKFDSDYDLVSLLIGANNQYRRYGIEQYRKEFDHLLNLAVGFSGKSIYSTRRERCP